MGTDKIVGIICMSVIIMTLFWVGWGLYRIVHPKKLKKTPGELLLEAINHTHKARNYFEGEDLFFKKEWNFEYQFSLIYSMQCCEYCKCYYRDSRPVSSDSIRDQEFIKNPKNERKG